MQAVLHIVRPCTASNYTCYMLLGGITLGLPISKTRPAR